MTPERANALAASLDVGLQSGGVCPACLSLVASELETGDGRVIAGRITLVAPSLWAEGLGDSVRAALDRSHARDAPDGLRELDERGFRSRTFRAVVRRLAEELEEEAERAYRAYRASLN